MKKATIARFVIGGAAIFAAFGLAACGAETGAPEAEGVGQTSEALNVGSGTPEQRAQFAASCRLFDATWSKEYFVYAGGTPSSGAATNRIVLAKKDASTVTGAWVTQTPTLSVARTEPRAIAIGDDLCYVVGGEDGSGASSGAVDVLHLVPGVNSTTDATIEISTTITPKPLATARSKFQLSTCKDNSNKIHLVAVNGHNSTAGDAIADIEVSDDISKTTTWSNWSNTIAAGSFQVGAQDFGLAKNGTANQYLLAGGRPAGGVRNNAIDLITMSTSCVPTILPAKDVSNNPVTLSASVEGNVVAFENTASVFTANFGTSANGTLWNSGDTLTVSNWGTGVVSKAAGGNAIPNTLARLPVLVEAGTKRVYVGGTNAAGTASVTAVQKYTSGTGFSLLATASPAIFAPAVAYFPTASKVVYASGLQLGTGLTNVVAEVTP